ncbi:MAG: hypothetical protein ACO1N9_03785 [Flavobacterium sp.]
MRKDIFIDNNIASKFSNPQDKEYIKLTKWLVHFDSKDLENIDNYAHLIVSQKLMVEYFRSAYNAKSDTSIPAIIDKLTRENRLIKVSNQELKQFKDAYFSSRIIRNLKCNTEDMDHIPVVLLSDRKYALTYDQNLKDDLEGFPGFIVNVQKRPEDLPYL